MGLDGINPPPPQARAIANITIIENKILVFMLIFFINKTDTPQFVTINSIKC